MEQLRRAVDLVQGRYLDQTDMQWAIEERERLGQLYTSALEELACIYLDINELDQCLFICQRVLLHDRCNESIYQLEMQVYSALGDRASVVRRYQACRIALQEDLGLSPAQETEELYRDLTAS